MFGLAATMPFVGSPAGGSATDAIPRRAPIAAPVVFASLSIGAANADSFKAFTTLRALSGPGIGMALPDMAALAVRAGRKTKET